MSKIVELRTKYSENLEKAEKEREQLLQRANQLSQLIEQLKGAVFALTEAGQPEPAPAEAPKAEEAPKDEEPKKE